MQELRGLTVADDAGGDPGYYNIFIPLYPDEHASSVIIAENMEEFGAPLLDRVKCRDHLEYMERLAGKSSGQSATISMELVRDVEKGTVYPPEHTMSFTGAEMVTVVDNIIKNIELKKSETSQED